MPDEPQPDGVVDRARWLDEIERLQADRAHRDRRGAFFAEGVRNVVQAVECGAPIEALVYSDRLLTAPLARHLLREQREAGTCCVSVSPEEFRRVSRTVRASGVAAVVGQWWDRLHKVSPRAGICWVALAEVRSPGNLGSLIRTSEAIGGAGFLLLGMDVDPFDPAVVRASMGAIFRQRFVRTNAASLRNWVRRHGCQVVGVTPEGATEYHRFAYPRATVLLLGEERKGLTEDQCRLCTHSVRIPMTGKADSLNVAVAGSLLLYEVYRAREHFARPATARRPRRVDSTRGRPDGA
jgi:TrmH family RNA methyltransferase